MAAGEGNNTLSMREKALLKNHVNKQHNSNFQAGYVPIYEPYLHKTGLRGRKGMLFYCLVVILFIIALANLAVTLLLLSVLRIGYGMESLEFISHGLLLRFLNHADLGKVIPAYGVVAGFGNEDLTLTGNNQKVIIQAKNVMDAASLIGNGPSMEVGVDHILIQNADEFRVRSPSTGRTLFSTNYKDFKLPPGISNLAVKEAHVSRITSATSEPLTIFSQYQTVLKGNEGLSIDGQEIVWVAGLDVYLKSVNQSVRLDGKKGVRLSTDKLPLAAEPLSGARRWYKVCVCMPSGKVFRVPVRNYGHGCNDVRFPESINPCVD
ncbi:sarcoglycan beta isoform X1 [Tachypleus tridentatus]|uniref:sarcoglycan beta isoform X1 n=2 Tax=Tachypleus tridentatus TaxID=6853 RepID=UPI003FD30997